MNRRRGTWRWLAAGLWLLWVPAIAIAAEEDGTRCSLSEEDQASVNHFLNANNGIDYRGTLLLEYSNDREFVSISVDGTDSGASLTRLSRRAGDTPEMLPLHRTPRRGACQLDRFYGFSVDDGPVVAGHSTMRITVQPRDTLRLGYVLDVDRATGMPLRVVAARPDGKMLERFEFAEFNVLPESSSRPPRERQEQPGITLASLPPGFQLVEGGVSPVPHLVVSDGLASVSVFVEPKPRALSDGEGLVLRGSTLTYTRGRRDNLLVTVLGEVPVTTARLLAEAVRTSGGG